MKNIKRFLLLQSLLLFVIPYAFAEISITLPAKETYNLGEKIMPTISIKEEQNHDGFFKLHLVCDNYNLQYYTIPIKLEANIRTQVQVPELPLSGPMIGSCSIKAGLDKNDGTNFDAASSAGFLVSNLINIITEENLHSDPGKDILILGDVRKASGELLSEGELSINFRDENEGGNITAGKLEHMLHIDANTEAGEYAINIAIRDKEGNLGDKIVKIEIPQIPTSIQNEIENDVLAPGDTLKAKIALYDHTNKLINVSNINVKVFDPDESPIAEKEVQSSGQFELGIEKHQAPGVYFLFSSYENVDQQSTFTVVMVKKIAMKQENNIVHIENTGNVNYDDETTIILEGNDKKYLINKKLDLKPGESIEIDLSKEVPGGTYDVILPEEAVEQEEPAGENIIANETSQESFEAANVIKDVLIEDKRNAIKKIADGLRAVTGAVVSTASYIVSKPKLASIILVTIILGIITYYSRDYITQRIKGNKPGGETSKLFKDFNFKEKQ
ncbi:hypothetical protein HYU50_03555 [Candidatus Woesearchaeota archaeon]|nr:hypothetical protein [Candidatus Woesearchaeota archaeon]